MKQEECVPQVKEQIKVSAPNNKLDPCCMIAEVKQPHKFEEFEAKHS